MGCWLIGAILLPLYPLEARADSERAAAIAFFESKIRPVLVESCFDCHSQGAKELRGGLKVDSLEGLLQGGTRGPAIVPGHPDQSPLITAIRHGDPDLKMPWKRPRLSQSQVSDLTAWVRAGAVWPSKPGVSSGSGASVSHSISPSNSAHWAFLPVQRPSVPQSRLGASSSHPIDAFVHEKLAQNNLQPNGPAGMRELVRRLFFGITGLPPAPEEMAAFLKDPRSDAWVRLVDRVLASPAYGERWGRHWLDVARFAQSNGYERDGEKPLAWRYRDYVIKAFNDDKPFDRFAREHIAGDLLEDSTFESVIATGFQRLGVWDDEPDDKQQAEFEELDDMLSTTGAAFLGVTIGCARCHDHKLDPFTQKDYYQLLAFFRQVRPSENAKYILDSANYVPLEPPAKVRAWADRQAADIAALESELKVVSVPEQKKRIEDQLKQKRESSPPFEWALAARERTNPPPSHILVRGRLSTPGAQVQPGFPSVLGNFGPAGTSSNALRRVDFADWLVDRRHPLTARVMVNRLWHHHFGQGLVATTTDFGKAGTPPTHPELLDWLAAQFIDTGWSLKHLQRLILTSETYRRSSAAHHARAETVDPANRLLWRHSVRRVEAEVMRDAMLAVSGTLNRWPGGRGFFPDLAGEVHAGTSRPGQDWEKMPEAQLSRRSVYAYARRTTAVPALEVFDYNNNTSPMGERPVTTVAPQALLLLNDPFVHRQASMFARRLEKESGPAFDAQIRRGYALALSRQPDARELAEARDFVEKQTSAFLDLDQRLDFKPDASSSFLSGFLNRLGAEDLLIGPRRGWGYHRGVWSKAYEGIRTVERVQAPFALYEGLHFRDGTVETRLNLDRSTDFFSLLLRSVSKDDAQIGYEFSLEARAGKVSLRKHSPSVETLAERTWPIPLHTTFTARIEAEGPRLRLWLNGDPHPVIDVTDANPRLESGSFGVRAWGAPGRLDRAGISTAGQTHAIPGGWRDQAAAPEGKGSFERWARAKALEAFCLLLLNLNEFVYVD